MNNKNQNGFSKIAIIAIIVVVIVIGVFVFLKLNKGKEAVVNNQEGKDVLIGFSITSLQEERWQKDKAEFMKRAEEIGATVDLQVAQNDAAKQVSQIEAMIVKGVDAIVVVPFDADSLKGVIEKAHAAGIKVISYDRLVRNSNVDLYVSFDNEKVGEYEAQYVIDALKSKMDQGEKMKIAYVGGAQTDNNAHLLKNGSWKILDPLIKAGKVEIVSEGFTPDWNPDKAYATLKAYLAKSGGKIDGVVAANDGTAFGAISALKEIKLDGKVPVSGQDAELAALQRIIAGTQIVTVYKPIPLLASNAVELAIKLAKGAVIDTAGKVTDDGKYKIPSVLLDPIAVNKDNIDDTVIKDGYHKRGDIYKSL
jgi:D-xylose transport system substrate-binding protein